MAKRIQAPVSVSFVPVSSLSPVALACASDLAALAGGGKTLAKTFMAVIKSAPAGQARATVEAVILAAREKLIAGGMAADKAAERVDCHAVKNVIAKARRVADHADAHGANTLGASTSVSVVADKLSKALGDAAGEKAKPATGVVHKTSDAAPAGSPEAKPAPEAKPLSIATAIAFLAEDDSDLAQALTTMLGDNAKTDAFIAWVQAGCKAPIQQVIHNKAKKVKAA